MLAYKIISGITLIKNRKVKTAAEPVVKGPKIDFSLKEGQSFQLNIAQPAKKIGAAPATLTEGESKFKLDISKFT
jgi:hypothetical protein